jgi:hypothetical protein
MTITNYRDIQQYRVRLLQQGTHESDNTIEGLELRISGYLVSIMGSVRQLEERLTHQISSLLDDLNTLHEAVQLLKTNVKDDVKSSNI